MAEKTLDQRRAQHAWTAIEQQVTGRKDDANDYAREAKKLPVRITTAGLGQALAFIDAKRAKKPGLKRLHEDLTDWVVKKRLTDAPKAGSLLECIIQGDADFFRRATDETLAYLQWLNRFAEGRGLPESEE